MEMMNKTSMPLLLVCLFFFFFVSVESKTAQLAPALYVFGDSIVDAGNNDILNTKAKANFPPYGIDFIGGLKAGGRFTNGRTIVDFYAKWLGIKTSPPPFLHVNLERAKIYQGFNFASGSSGILPESGKELADLYKLGARKFVVYEIPAAAIDAIDRVIATYNVKLGEKLQQLTSTLKGSTFILAKFFDLAKDLKDNPTRYGFKDSNPCCMVSQEGPACIPNTIPCIDRDRHALFDKVHPSEAAYNIMATKCFSEKGFCVPMNLKQLAMAGGTKQASPKIKVKDTHVRRPKTKVLDVQYLHV
ncbi:GDSL esterase/lipase [Quillaja saponaria]|uniref:GDSL esterase/lipase n=1 Tax=Quillaja saponaria TaxID=32244 RepID=A0AAD7P8B1_QUISA|nr:GDSL esterase/lipase [Quillaja saponaria]